MSIPGPAPIRFAEHYRPLIWGGRRLASVLGKDLPLEEDVAESWEVSDYADVTSVVADGPLAGRTLRDLMERERAWLMGEGFEGERFPLLVKFLDASKRLSVQVHPDDAYARAHEPWPTGKVEAWYVLHAEPGSRLIRGLAPGVTRESFAEAVAAGTVEDCLHSFEVAAGDCIPIPAGTLHAICEGVVLAEVQQTSDATYRVHDWGRLGSDGRPRELHVDKALDVIDFTPQASDRIERPADPPPIEKLWSCEIFSMAVLHAAEGLDLPATGSFQVLCGVGGSGEITWPGGSRSLRAGETLLLPAALEGCRLEGGGADFDLLRALPSI